MRRAPSNASVARTRPLSKMLRTSRLMFVRTGHPIRMCGIAAALLSVGLALSSDSLAAQSERRGRSRQELVAKLTGKPVHVDAATRRVRAITQQEAGALIDQIAALTEATASPDEVALLGGGRMLRLSGHGAGHVLVSRPNASGTASVRCVTSPEEAVDFLADEAAEDLPER
jgi:hypothetical protein